MDRQLMTAAGLTAVALALGAAGAASAQPLSSNSASYNAGYGRIAGQENRAVELYGRDANGNRVIIDGVIQTGQDQSVYARSSIGGAFDAYSGVGNLAGGASAVGNSLNVITQGSHNTVIVDSTQINQGAVTATTTVSRKSTDGQ